MKAPLREKLEYEKVRIFPPLFDHHGAILMPRASLYLGGDDQPSVKEEVRYEK
jgi:hypothetical protein